MDSAQAALDRLCCPQAEVSAHYLISAQGEIIRMVAEEQRAWHAGAGEWAGCTDVNSRSIGIELDNKGNHPFAEPQMRMLERLLAEIMKRWDIPAKGVIGHSDMAPGRKIDPGPHFDWARLARQGLARSTVDPAPTTKADPAEFRKAARRVGFTADVDDQTLLSAVRLRFRPYATGPLTGADFAPLGPA